MAERRLSRHRQERKYASLHVFSGCWGGEGIYQHLLVALSLCQDPRDAEMRGVLAGAGGPAYRERSHSGGRKGFRGGDSWGSLQSRADVNGEGAWGERVAGAKGQERGRQ